MACHFGLKCLERNVALFFILQINLIEFYHKTLISKEHSEKLELLLINGVLTIILKKIYNYRYFTNSTLWKFPCYKGQKEKVN